MSTSSSDPTCPRCGGPLPGAPGALCPRCLLAEAMEPTRSGDAPAAAPTLTPEELAPHFPALEILRCLGRGGMGVVYEARQRSLNRRVALKLLAPERADDPRFAARFEREAQALAALSHPHIVAVHDFGRAGGFYYLLMEFVDGLNLRQLLRSRRLSPREALAIVPPVCDALQCAHDHGIVHRDIKPENLLIDRGGTVKIADFGIAALVGPRDADTPESDGAAASVTLALGTPDYAAPEQAAGAVDARADIYSLGVVLYEMLTGERPSGPIEPPSRRVRLDVRIDEVVLRALESSPARRYATAAEFRARVEAVTVADAPAPPPPPKIGTATLTTVEAISTWRGQLAHPRTRGSLLLDDQRLTHSRPGLTTVIPLDAIEELSVGRYPRSMNPHGLAVLSVVYREQGGRRQALISPMEGWFARPSTWDARVEEWRAAISAAARRATGREPASRPADQLGIPRGKPWPMILVLIGPILLAFALLTGLFRPEGGPGPLPSSPLGLPEMLILSLLAFFWFKRRARRSNRVAVVLLVWTLFHLAHALLVLGSRSLLPVNPAGHFNAVGLGDRWVSRDGLLWATAALPPALGLLFLGVAPLLRRLPPRFIRVPRPDYWLSPERRPLLVEEVFSNFAALSCLFTLFFAGLHGLVILANHQSPPSMPSTPLLVLVIAFLLLLLLWLVAFLLRLARADDPPDRSPAEVSVRLLFMVWLAVASVGGGMVMRQYLHPGEASQPPVHLASLPAMDVMHSLELPWEARVQRDCALTLRHVWRDGGSEVMQVVSGPSPSSPERPVRVSVMLHKVSATRVGMRVQIGPFPQAKEFEGNFDLLAREMRERPWEGTRAIPEDGVIELCRVAGAPVTLRVSRPPEPVPVAADASDPAWMEIVREGGEKQPPATIGSQRIAGWHRVVWVVRASRPGWVEFRHGGAPLVAPLVRDESTGLHQRSLYVEIRRDEGAGVKYGYRLGEPEWPDAPSAGNDGRKGYEALSRELDESGKSSIRPSRGREAEVFRLDGRPATLRLLEGPSLPPSADRDMALSSAMEAIQTGQFCLLGIPGQTPTNLTHDAATGYPIVWLPVGGPAESLELFNETMRAWHRKQGESKPER